MRSVSMESVEFVNSMKRNDITDSQKLDLLRKACTRHTLTNQDACEGLGNDDVLVSASESRLQDEFVTPWLWSTCRHRSSPDGPALNCGREWNRRAQLLQGSDLRSHQQLAPLHIPAHFSPLPGAPASSCAPTLRSGCSHLGMNSEGGVWTGGGRRHRLLLRHPRPQSPLQEYSIAISLAFGTSLTGR